MATYVAKRAVRNGSLIAINKRRTDGDLVPYLKEASTGRYRLAVRDNLLTVDNPAIKDLISIIEQIDLEPIGSDFTNHNYGNMNMIKRLLSNVLSGAFAGEVSFEEAMYFVFKGLSLLDPWEEVAEGINEVFGKKPEEGGGDTFDPEDIDGEDDPEEGIADDVEPEDEENDEGNTGCGQSLIDIPRGPTKITQVDRNILLRIVQPILQQIIFRQK